jgi:hypothetical protein
MSGEDDGESEGGDDDADGEEDGEFLAGVGGPAHPRRTVPPGNQNRDWGEDVEDGDEEGVPAGGKGGKYGLGLSQQISYYYLRLDPTHLSFVAQPMMRSVIPTDPKKARPTKLNTNTNQAFLLYIYKQVLMFLRSPMSESESEYLI